MFKFMNDVAISLLPWIVVGTLAYAAAVNTTTVEATGRKQTFELLMAFICVIYAAVLYNFIIAVVVASATITMVMKGRVDKITYTRNRVIIFFIICLGLGVVHHYWF